MGVLCVVNTNLIWENDIGRLLNDGEWNTILLSRCISFPCLPPVGTKLYLESEDFNDLVVQEICFFEKGDRVGETPVFHLECGDQNMGTWEGSGMGQILIERVGEYLADGWELGEYADSDKVFERWKKYVEEHEGIVLEKKDSAGPAPGSSV